jgi:aldehyde dehydrogenase (NAD+)
LDSLYKSHSSKEKRKKGMAAMIEITLPNGLKYEQPIGLFVNNEFHEPNGEEFTVFNPS